MNDSEQTLKANAESNLSAFIRFRVFFNARFYYPVFTIIFLDYGLTLEQFAILNMVWAITIVLAEVPSGALADIVGRKNLVAFAACLMVVELSLLVWVPIGQSYLLFAVFFINRVASGLAEAAASGADEALAYDSLKELGREDEWAHLLEKVTRYTSMGFFATMIIGASVYDVKLINAILGRIGLELSHDWIIRLPIILTLVTSLIVVHAAFQLKELHPPKASDHDGWMAKIGAPFKQILRAGSWTWNHDFVLLVILCALALDSVARHLVVLASEYYRIIEIPIVALGPLGAGMALLGVLWAKLGKTMVHKLKPQTIFLILSVAIMIGLTGVRFAIPYFGVLFAIMVFCMMGFVSYLSSYYINKHVESEMRATVLSFRGLAINLGLGIISLLYTFLITAIKKGKESAGEPIEQVAVFTEALNWFPGYYLLLFALIIVKYQLTPRKELRGIDNLA